MLNFLRWLAVLPGAIVVALLATFPLRFLLYQTLTGSGIIVPYPETPERLLTPMVIAIAFIWAGSRIAPSHKLKTSVVLFAIWLLLLGGMFVLGLTGAKVGSGQFYLQNGGFAAVGALVGAFVGLYIVRKETRAAA